ncbi:hypothetical protein GF339_21625 [candidate division KSB3 bacterium]|uniref:Alpha-L-rhamnosidase six-hairpin glycosidase domain-containing protein n=1 Tax=candidate division KSB3 bacterium TaxID=2044937 RepID=A0A9D5K077_9BACT|nr:hypothetical protein [candidate division KSB3 bacterium]MBD3327201.1 hypothetical protein [candidate division KSB3 bacterium]
MWLKRFVWKYIVRRIAHSHGFLDPIALLGQLRKFAPSSEVSEPIELLRAGAVFHARGLVNRSAIQHNLDWVWPFWVERQFNPLSSSFLPRGFSITHVNLTHRNWTAVGIPDCHAFPIVDPRGLITPLWDSWSLDGWIIPEEGEALLPSRLTEMSQELVYESGSLVVKTISRRAHLTFLSEVFVELLDGQPVCHIQYQLETDRPAWFVIALRPYNPEGISFIHNAALENDRRGWTINREPVVQFRQPVEHHLLSTYQHGDVFRKLRDKEEVLSGHCDVGLVTAAAMYALTPDQTTEIGVDVPLKEDAEATSALATGGTLQAWPDALGSAARLEIPDRGFQHLYDTAVRTLILLSPDWTYPGPYTYKRFWYRDAAFLVNGLLCANLLDRAERVVNRFPERQNLMGYFHSQEGEWDTNGEALWTFYRLWELSGKFPQPDWLRVVEKGAEWIVRKRLSDDLDAWHAGLFPPGFSAEHLGNIDYYYWDNFWNVAGLQAAAALLNQLGGDGQGQKFEQEATTLMQAIERSLTRSQEVRDAEGFPASPYRRMDAGAVGSIVAGYPLELLPPDDPRLLGTVQFLLENCFVHGAFFQDMIHSGMNAYLSLQLAQILLRAGDPRFFELVRGVADLATPTGQWPEAIHPHTKGGCMGDGQHAWAAAEWIVMMRNLFVREEGNRLIVGAGIVSEWLEAEQPLHFGPTPTRFGKITLDIEPRSPTSVQVKWQAQWHRESAPPVDVVVPGYDPVYNAASSGEYTEVTLSRNSD